uniref:Uncharacterized protein n=3 Tax=Auxenochlorella protothecoides TaxID=3075 RepID=A0A1D2AFX1_AUXPR
MKTRSRRRDDRFWSSPFHCTTRVGLEAANDLLPDGGCSVPVRPARDTRPLEAAADAHSLPVPRLRVEGPGFPAAQTSSGFGWPDNELQRCSSWGMPNQSASALRLPSLPSMDADGIATLPDPKELEQWLTATAQGAKQGAPPPAQPAHQVATPGRGPVPSHDPGASGTPKPPHIVGVDVQATPPGSQAAVWAAVQVPGPGGSPRVFSGVPLKASQLVAVSSGSALSADSAPLAAGWQVPPAQAQPSVESVATAGRGGEAAVPQWHSFSCVPDRAVKGPPPRAWHSFSARGAAAAPLPARPLASQAPVLSHPRFRFVVDPSQ